MVPEENLWSPKIEMPEQCKYCEMWFHQNIGGICNPCYQVMSRELYNQPVTMVEILTVGAEEEEEEVEVTDDGEEE